MSNHVDFFHIGSMYDGFPQKLKADLLWLIFAQPV